MFLKKNLWHNKANPTANRLMYKIAALYRFVTLDHPEQIRTLLRQYAASYKIIGTLILAHEGINGTIAGEPEALDAFLRRMTQLPVFTDLDIKYASSESPPFRRMKIHLKKEIVTLGQAHVNPNEVVGTYLSGTDWNKLISDPEVVVIDTRNDYEYLIGSFKGAINPKTKTFRSFPDYVKANLDPKKHKKVAMFCTGGIRCEKSTSYLKSLGFESVYHLKGGILKYLEDMDPSESLWEGACFVFDERTAVTHGLKESGHVLCRGCRYPLQEADQQHPHYLHGVHCPHCYSKLTPKKLKSASDRQKQYDLMAQKHKKATSSKSPD